MKKKKTVPPKQEICIDGVWYRAGDVYEYEVEIKEKKKKEIKEDGESTDKA